MAPAMVVRDVSWGVEAGDGGAVFRICSGGLDLGVRGGMTTLALLPFPCNLSPGTCTGTFSFSQAPRTSEKPFAPLVKICLSANFPL